MITRTNTGVESDRAEPTPTWRAGIVAESEAMREVLDGVARVARSVMPVFIVGETGTGKDVLAQALHQASGRRGPFVAINCTAIAAGTAESELFGHVRGAFTNAHETRRGLVAQADHGTLFLDEIGDMELGLQGKLLRVLEDGLVRPMGAQVSIPVNVRVIAATHRDLPALVREGRFRADLYHRLNGITLAVSPLRERPEDIPALAARFLGEVGDPAQPKTIAPVAMEWLCAQRWPGNVRELRNAVCRAALLGADPLMPADFVGATIEIPEAQVPEAWLAGRTWAEIERDVIAWALERHGGVRAAARALAVPRSTLCERARQRGLTS